MINDRYLDEVKFILLLKCLFFVYIFYLLIINLFLLILDFILVLF